MGPFKTRASSIPLALRVVTATPLAACSNPVREAKERYEFVQKGGGSAAEVCAKGRALVDAYLAAKDLDDYRLNRLVVDVECERRKSEESRGIFRDQNGNEMAPILPDDMSM